MKKAKARAGIDGTRRLLIAGAGTLSAVAAFKQAHGLAAPVTPAVPKTEKEAEDVIRYPHVHEGKGAIDVRFFFRSEEWAKPALLLTYTIPPGASEGVHTHRPGDLKMGSYDEFYYIISGGGEMQVAGRTFPVTAGDHVFTPNEVAHGIENTSETAVLKLYLVAMIR